MTNLDYLCIKHGQQLSEAGETYLRKAFGVLKEDGVYAMFLWLEYKAKDKKIREKLIDLMNEQEIKRHLLNEPANFEIYFTKFCETLRNIATDIDKLLFLKKILERTLIYGLYHAKTREDKNDMEKT